MCLLFPLLLSWLKMFFYLLHGALPFSLGRVTLRIAGTPSRGCQPGDDGLLSFCTWEARGLTTILSCQHALSKPWHWTEGNMPYFWHWAFPIVPLPNALLKRSSSFLWLLITKHSGSLTKVKDGVGACSYRITESLRFEETSTIIWSNHTLPPMSPTKGVFTVLRKVRSKQHFL